MCGICDIIPHMNRKENMNEKEMINECKKMDEILKLAQEIKVIKNLTHVIHQLQELELDRMFPSTAGVDIRTPSTKGNHDRQ